MQIVFVFSMVIATFLTTNGWRDCPVVLGSEASELATATIWACLVLMIRDLGLWGLIARRFWSLVLL